MCEAKMPVIDWQDNCCSSEHLTAQVQRLGPHQKREWQSVCAASIYIREGFGTEAYPWPCFPPRGIVVWEHRVQDVERSVRELAVAELIKIEARYARRIGAELQITQRGLMETLAGLDVEVVRRRQELEAVNRAIVKGLQDERA